MIVLVYITSSLVILLAILSKKFVLILNINKIILRIIDIINIAFLYFKSPIIFLYKKYKLNDNMINNIISTVIGINLLIKFKLLN